jgi:hypothetical protein
LRSLNRRSLLPMAYFFSPVAIVSDGIVENVFLSVLI